MPFAYYDRLNAARQRIYRRSDGITEIAMPGIDALRGYVRAIETALSTGDRGATECACQALVTAINGQMKTPPIRVRVLARRPSDDYGELHGLYEPEDDGKVAVISVWMRTAQKDQVVKFRTFLRTLIHEVCHHLDYEHYQLAETFHTEGFYKRESVLLNQLLAQPATPELPGLEA